MRVREIMRARVHQTPVAVLAAPGYFADRAIVTNVDMRRGEPVAVTVRYCVGGQSVGTAHKTVAAWEVLDDWNGYALGVVDLAASMDDSGAALRACERALACASSFGPNAVAVPAVGSSV